MMHLNKLPNQRKGETVEIFLRRHWIEPFTIIIVSFFILAIPAAIAVIFEDLVASWLAHPLMGPIVVTLAAMYILLVWLVATVEFLDYYLDSWIVTSERIINIEQLGLFRRNASELHLNTIQDVTAEINGVLHTMLNYGNVHVSTAAETLRFNFKNVPNPEKIKNRIIELVEADKKRHGSAGKKNEVKPNDKPTELPV